MLLKYLSKIPSNLFLDLNRNPGNTIFISSVGRSGSTFLSEVINHSNEYRIIFEPFYPPKTQAGKVIDYPKYLDPQKDYPLEATLIENVIKGKIWNPWVNEHNRKTLVSKRIIKSIRSNLLVNWISSRFPYTPIILLIRHPLATVEAWKRCGWNMSFEFRKKILVDQQLVNDFLYPFIDTYREENDEFVLKVMNWCINYYVPLRHGNSSNICLCFYENLIKNPIQELNKLSQFLNLEISQDTINRLKVNSRTTRMDSYVRDRINGWKTGLSSEELIKGTGVLELFGMQGFYDNNSLPNNSAVTNF